MLWSDNDKLQEVAFGMIIFSLGLIGMLKAVMEMAENHRLDKNTGKGETLTR